MTNIVKGQIWQSGFGITKLVVINDLTKGSHPLAEVVILTDCELWNKGDIVTNFYLGANGEIPFTIVGNN